MTVRVLSMTVCLALWLTGCYSSRGPSYGVVKALDALNFYSNIADWVLGDPKDPNTAHIRITEFAFARQPGEGERTGTLTCTGKVRYIPAKNGGTLFTDWTNVAFSFQLLDEKNRTINTITAPLAFPDSVDVRSIEAEKVYPFSMAHELPAVQLDKVKTVKLTGWSNTPELIDPTKLIDPMKP
jgi:hypothetical protein